MFHIDHDHGSWIRYRKEGNIIICLCLECELTYECKDGWKCRCKINFNKHYTQVHTFVCDLCENFFGKENDLKHHIENRHKSELLSVNCEVRRLRTMNIDDWLTDERAKEVIEEVHALVHLETIRTICDTISTTKDGLDLAFAAGTL